MRIQDWQKFNEQHLVIVDKEQKEELVLSFFKHAFLPQFKIFTFEELKQFLTYSLSEELILQFAQKNQLSMENAWIYLNHLSYIQENKEYVSFRLQELQNLKKKNADLLATDKGHLQFLKGKTVVVYQNQKYFKEIETLCQVYQLKCLKVEGPKVSLKEKEVFCFDSIEEEVEYVAVSIAQLIEKGINPSKIKLCYAQDNLAYQIEKIFKFFRLPVVSKPSKYIEIPFYKQFLEILKLHSSVKEALDCYQKQLENTIDEDKIQQLMTICNQWIHLKHEDFILVLEYYFKTHTINLFQAGMIEKISYHQKVSNDCYVFVLGLNQGIIPQSFKDEDFFSDVEKKELHLTTSEEKNQIELEDLKRFFAETKNLFMSYHLKENNKVCYPAILIDLWHFIVKRPTLSIYDSYSTSYDQIKLADAYDKNTQNAMIKVLEENYLIDYCQYQNQFRIQNHQTFIDAIQKEKITLSYSTMNTFFQCPYQYYLSQICLFKDNQSTFNQEIGTLFHFILANEKEIGFDWEKNYDHYFDNQRILSSKEKFYLTKLKKELQFLLSFNHEMESHTQFKKTLCEQRLLVSYDNPMILPIKGFIDKMMIYEDNQATYFALIDYKTGNPTLSLKHLQFGLSMQLPVYLYLVNHNRKRSQDLVVGFYLQKIIPELNKYPQDSNENKRTNLKLQGYTIALKDKVALLDDTYNSSQWIKGLKTKKDGSFYQTSKVLTLKEMEDISNLVEEKIKEASFAILSGDFKIQPKIINHKNESCKYCEYQHICHVKANDYLYLWIKEKEGEHDE